MPQQGRGSAGRTNATMVVQVVVVLCLMLHLEYTHAATQAVGDSGGWTFNSDSWPNGKHFRAGDVLCKFDQVLLLKVYILRSFFCLC